MSMPAKRAIRFNYFFYAFATGSAFTYLAPYFKENLGVADYTLGLLLMLRPAVAILAQPFWSHFADSHGHRARVAAGLAVAAGLLFPLIRFAGPMGLLVLAIMAHSFFNAPLNSLADSMTFDYLGHHKRMRFANFRIFASFGFVTAVALIGKVYDRFGIEWLFAAYSISILIAVFFILRIPLNGKARSGQSGGKAIRSLLRKKNVILFLVSVLFVETANQMAYTYLSVYGKALGANNAQAGWIWAVATLAEMVTMYHFSKIAGRHGIWNILAVGMGTTILRWTLFAFMRVWWQLIPLQLMHIFTLTFVYVGSAIFMDLESPASIRFTSQAFYSTFVLNAGMIIGSIAGGAIAHRWGYSTIFLFCGGLSLIGTLVFILFVKPPKAHESHGHPVQV